MDNDYIIIGAKEEISTSIKLSKYYKMQTEGNYTIRCNMNLGLTKIGQNKKYLSLSSNYINIYFTPSFTDSPFSKKSSKAKFNGCTQSKKNILNAAYNQARNIASESYSTLNNAPIRTWGNRYNVWFGEAYWVRQKKVISNFKKIKDALPKLTYDCSSCQNPYTYSYIYPSKPHTIYLCDSFWDLPTTNGAKSKAGLLIHETSRFDIVANTDIGTSGETATQNLSIYYPSKTATNASSYEYFATNTPKLYMNNIFNNFTMISNIIKDLPIANSISFSTEKDIYKFRVNQSGLYTFYTTGAFDTVGMLLNSKFYKIAKNDDTSDINLNFKITHNLEIGMTYYLKVSGYTPNIGSYSLRSYVKNRKFTPIMMSDGLTIVAPL